MFIGKYITLVVAIVALAVSIFCSTQLYMGKNHTNKIVYVETNLVYAKFKGKAELEKPFIANQNKQKELIDSLSFEFKSLERQYSSSSVSANEKSILMSQMEAVQQNYNRLYKEFSAYNEAEKQKLIDQIWKQLNQYITDYGKEKKCAYILGANGDGAIMYAVDKQNVTNDVIEYVNKKYEGR